MAQHSINQLLVMKKSLIERRNQLKDLVRQSAVTRQTQFGDKVMTETAKYDVADVDKRVTECEMALFQIDAAVKESNAKTMVEVPVDFNRLMGPLQRPVDSPIQERSK